MMTKRILASVAVLLSLSLVACGKDEPAAPYEVEEVAPAGITITPRAK